MYARKCAPLDVLWRYCGDDTSLRRDSVVGKLGPPNPVEPGAEFNIPAKMAGRVLGAKSTSEADLCARTYFLGAREVRAMRTMDVRTAPRGREP